jgi:1-acyl-sn-glycerol-3-phosphate acyltransferase
MIARTFLFFSSLLVIVINIIYPTIWYVSLKFCQLLWWLMGKELPRTYTDKFATAWGLLQIGAAFPLNRTKIKMEVTPEAAAYEGPMLVMMNHQSTFDIAAAYYTLWKLGRNLRWVLKKELLNVPAIGTACYETKCAFVDRTDRKKAEEELLRFSKQIEADGVSAVIFVEGTRATPRKMEKSNYKYLLNPKPMGISILHEQLPHWPILSVTLDWVGKTGTTIFNTSIWGATLRIDCRLIMPEELPADHDGFVKWLFEVDWPRREALIESWRREAGLLPSPSHPDNHQTTAEASTIHQA